MNSNRSANMYNNSSYNEKATSEISHTKSSNLNIKQLSYPCRYHLEQICLNYCIEPKCFQALCSECIEDHLLHHKKQGLNDLAVKSFKSVRADCSTKLLKIIDKLLSKLGILQQSKNPQQMLQDSDKQLQHIRQVMHQIIDQQFLKVKQSIKHKISETFATIKQLTEINQNLLKIINQLKQHNIIISEGIIDNHINVTDSVQKTILLNQNALLQMFEKQSWKYEQKYRGVNVEIMFNEGEFRQAVVGALKIGNTEGKGNDQSSFFQYSKNGPQNTSKATTLNFNNREQQNSRMRSRSRSPINDRSLNNFQSNTKPHQSTINYPILHFFQTGANALHLIDLRGSEPQKSTIFLGNNYIVPTYHASILAQKTGSLYISGGIIETMNSSEKSSSLSKFSLVTNQFKKEFGRVRSRSSHTLCQDLQRDCLYILGGFGETDEEQEEANFETTLEKVNLKTGEVEELKSSSWGGANIAIMSHFFIIKACSQGLEIYDTVKDIWQKIVGISGIPVDKAFARGAGYSVLTQNSILIYGGYNEQEQGRKDCFLMNLDVPNSKVSDIKVEIQKTNSPLPIAQGFWNNPGLFYQNYLYAVQNIEDQEGEPIQSERTLLRLDLQGKKWLPIKVSKSYKK